MLTCVFDADGTLFDFASTADCLRFWFHNESV